MNVGLQEDSYILCHNRPGLEPVFLVVRASVLNIISTK